MAKGKPTPPEKKAKIIAALMAGHSPAKVATDFKVDKSTVSRIKSALPSHDLQQVATEKKERLVDLIESHLTESLKAAALIAKQTQDELWRSKQSAENLAIFYGVLSDKSIRLLEAAQRAQELRSLSDGASSS